MFSKSAAYYDAIYSFKDFDAEAKSIHEVAQVYKRSEGNSLLDVACGTGKHLVRLSEWYVCEGLDLEPGLLEVARERLPDVTFHQADMTHFQLAHSFDVVTCLFSAIGYATDSDLLLSTLICISSHLVSGGVALIEPWFQPHEWNVGRPHVALVDQPELKIARMNTSGLEGDLSILDFHYLVGTSSGVEHFEERHVLRLVTHEEMEQVFHAAGLSFEILQPGPSGRGLFVGVKS